jgi:D-alanine-D-alanine ligase
MQDTPSDPGKFILRPSPNEVRNTHVLFHTKHATDLTQERVNRYGYTVVYHRTVLETLRNIGLRVTPGSETEMLFRPMDFDFIWFTQVDEPFLGHEMLIPCIGASRGIPFLGPSGPIRALSEDKVLGKALAASVGIDVAKHVVINPIMPNSDLSLPGRWVFKPRTGVMSEDLAFIDSEAGWRDVLAKVEDPRHANREFIAEEFVPGLNLTVPVVEGFPARSLPVFIERGESRNNILTEAGKEGRSSDYSSEPYTGPGAEMASAAAAQLAAAIFPFDYARFDFRFDPERNRLVFLEVNMNCAVGPAAVVARAAGLLGIDYPSLIGHIFTCSLRRQQRDDP